MSVIIDDPIDPFDTAAWERRLADLREQRAACDAETYDATLGSLQSGLAMARAGPPKAQFGSLRERLNSAK